MTNRKRELRTFVASRQGACSFCSLAKGEACAYASADGRPNRICAQCLSIILHLTADLARHEERQAAAAALTRLQQPHREVMDELAFALALKDVDGAVAIYERLGRNITAEEVRRQLEWTGAPTATGTQAGAPTELAKACSFCDAQKGEAAHLTQTVTAAICDYCVDLAATAILTLLLPPTADSE